MKRTSALLEAIARQAEAKPMTIGSLIALLQDRSFALVLLVLALPNALFMSTIPGFSTLTAIPMICIALQIVLGRDALWLPQGVADRSFSTKLLSRIIAKALPAVTWLEKFSQPRWLILVEGWGERLTGLLLLLLALVLALPLPGANFPPALAICLLTLALLEKDGIFALAGIMFSLSCLLLLGAAFELILEQIRQWF